MKFTTFISGLSSFAYVWAQTTQSGPQFNNLPFGGNLTAGTTYSISWTGGDSTVRLSANLLRIAMLTDLACIIVIGRRRSELCDRNTSP